MNRTEMQEKKQARMTRALWARGARFAMMVTLVAVLGSAQSGFSYSRAITINHTKVGNSDSASFPMLLSGTCGYLATTSNGGNVTNSNGYDIIFATDAACSTKVAGWEIESYSPTTGAVNIWINIANLSHTTDTVVYMCYGNSAISTFQSTTTATWNSNYAGVWHLPNGTTLSANDSTSNGSNATISGPSATTGIIGGAAAFNGSGDIVIGTGSNSLAGTFTIEAWVKPGTLAGWNGIGGSRTPYDASFDFKMTGGNTIYGDIGNGSAWIAPGVYTSFAYSTGVWYHVVFVVTPTGYTIYADGTQVGSGSYSASSPLLYDSNHLFRFGDVGDSAEWWNGSMGELRISSNARSADWITAEYNNQTPR